MLARARAASAAASGILSEANRGEAAGRTEHNDPKTGKRYAHFPKNGPSPRQESEKTQAYARKKGSEPAEPLAGFP